MTSQVSHVVLNNLIIVKDAAEISGYSLQYMRRLLRTGKITGIKIGQIWLIQLEAFENYLGNAVSSKDNPFGPK